MLVYRSPGNGQTTNAILSIDKYDGYTLNVTLALIGDEQSGYYIDENKATDGSVFRSLGRKSRHRPYAMRLVFQLSHNAPLEPKELHVS